MTLTEIGEALFYCGIGVIVGGLVTWLGFYGSQR